VLGVELLWRCADYRRRGMVRTRVVGCAAVAAVAVLAAAGCGEDNSPEALLGRGHATTARLSVESDIPSSDLAQGTEALEKFLRRYPEHTNLDSAQFMLASLYLAGQKFDEAAQMLIDLQAAHPKSRYAVRALVLAADVFENRLSDAKKALAACERLVEQYPEHDFVTNGSAAWLLNNVGKSPEEWDIPFPTDSVASSDKS
jgi:tetratricopeptide (TPR) repeat protein